MGIKCLCKTQSEVTSHIKQFEIFVKIPVSHDHRIYKPKLFIFNMRNKNNIFICFSCVFKKNLFIYFWLHQIFVASLRLCPAEASGVSFLLPGLWASHCGGFSCWWSTGSRCTGVSSAARGLRNCGSGALEDRLNSCGSWAQLLLRMWNLPGPGIKPVSSALAGRFLSTVPPGKSCIWFLYFCLKAFGPQLSLLQFQGYLNFFHLCTICSPDRISRIPVISYFGCGTVFSITLPTFHCTFLSIFSPFKPKRSGTKK